MDTAPTGFVVIGAGGLGCPALLALAAAGARDVIVVDHDRVEAHNLQRQVLYDISEVGAPKVHAAARRLPSLAIDGRQQRVEPEQAGAFVAELPDDAIVLECTDAPAVKFAINDACLRHGVPLVIGAAIGWQGQALAVTREHACYRCIYEAPPPTVPRCDEAGVLGSGVGHTGMLMAHLALRLRAGDDAVAGELWTLDLRTAAVRSLRPRPRPDCIAHPKPEASAATASA